MYIVQLIFAFSTQVQEWLVQLPAVSRSFQLLKLGCHALPVWAGGLAYLFARVCPRCHNCSAGDDLQLSVNSRLLSLAVRAEQANPVWMLLHGNSTETL